MTETTKKIDRDEETRIVLAMCMGIFFAASLFLFYKINDIKKDLDQVKTNQKLSMLEDESSRDAYIVSVPFADTEKIYCDERGPLWPNCSNKRPINIRDAVQLIIDQSGYKYEDEKTSTTPARFIK